MVVYVEFHCGGCFKVAKGTHFIRRELVPLFHGDPMRGGFMRKLPWNVDDVVPEGWVADDPYTGCCYCPACWAGIIADEPVEEPHP